MKHSWSTDARCGMMMTEDQDEMRLTPVSFKLISCVSCHSSTPYLSLDFLSAKNVFYFNDFIFATISHFHLIFIITLSCSVLMYYLHCICFLHSLTWMTEGETDSCSVCERAEPDTETHLYVCKGGALWLPAYHRHSHSQLPNEDFHSIRA